VLTSVSFSTNIVFDLTVYSVSGKPKELHCEKLVNHNAVYSCDTKIIFEFARNMAMFGRLGTWITNQIYTHTEFETRLNLKSGFYQFRIFYLPV
jgi:hypothetical protein